MLPQKRQCSWAVAKAHVAPVSSCIRIDSALRLTVKVLMNRVLSTRELVSIFEDRIIIACYSIEVSFKNNSLVTVRISLPVLSLITHLTDKYRRNGTVRIFKPT